MVFSNFCFVTYFQGIAYIDDPEVYNLIRNTWIGVRIDAPANLRQTLQEKHKNAKIDLSELFSI